MHRQLRMFMANSICIRDPQWNAESGIAMNNHCGMCTELVFLGLKQRRKSMFVKEKELSTCSQNQRTFLTAISLLMRFLRLLFLSVKL